MISRARVHARARKGVSIRSLQARVGKMERSKVASALDLKTHVV